MVHWSPTAGWPANWPRMLSIPSHCGLLSKGMGSVPMARLMVWLDPSPRATLTVIEVFEAMVKTVAKTVGAEDRAMRCPMAISDVKLVPLPVIVVLALAVVVPVNDPPAAQ